MASPDSRNRGIGRGYSQLKSFRCNTYKKGGRGSEVPAPSKLSTNASNALVAGLADSATIGYNFIGG